MKRITISMYVCGICGAIRNVTKADDNVSELKIKCPSCSYNRHVSWFKEASNLQDAVWNIADEERVDRISKE